MILVSVMIVIMIFVIIMFMLVLVLVGRSLARGQPTRRLCRRSVPMVVRGIRAIAPMPIAFQRILHETRDEAAVGAAADRERIVRLDTAHRRAGRFIADTRECPAGG